MILQDKTDQERFKELNWGLRTWDSWYFNDVDHRFSDPWPGRIPAIDENPENAILLLEYAKLLENCGWKVNTLDRLSPVNGKVYRKYGKQNAKKKNPRHYQKNLDPGKTKYPSQTRIINHTRKRNYESII